jgi:hypothetical protein
MVEEEVENSASLSAPVALSAPATKISSKTLEAYDIPPLSKDG